MSTSVTQLGAEHVQDLVNRITQTIHPLRIVIFGSAARGQMGPDSDVDVMVVMPDGTHCLDTTRHLYKQLFGFGFPVDILIATPELLERHKDNLGLIYRTVLPETPPPVFAWAEQIITYGTNPLSCGDHNA